MLKTAVNKQCAGRDRKQLVNKHTAWNCGGRNRSKGNEQILKGAVVVETGNRVLISVSDKYCGGRTQVVSFELVFLVFLIKF